MSSVNQPRVTAADEPSDADVADYLQSHPEFFERHPALLTSLRLPHRTGGAAVSLVERQVSVLRQRNLKLERKLRELVDVARSNDRLAASIHTLALALVSAGGRAEAIAVIESELRGRFRVDGAVLALFVDGGGAPESRFLRLVRRDDPEMAPFATFLDADRVRCGRIRDAQRAFLFGPDDVEIGSAALVPLGPGAELGFLAIGSRDANHFHPGKSIDFLARLGELVAAALRR